MRISFLAVPPCLCVSKSVSPPPRPPQHLGGGVGGARLQLALAEVEGVANAHDPDAQLGERERETVHALVGVVEAGAAAVDEGERAAATSSTRRFLWYADVPIDGQAPQSGVRLLALL